MKKALPWFPVFVALLVSCGAPEEPTVDEPESLQALVARAGVVTEMRKIKHHFDQGVEARRGIEF